MYNKIKNIQNQNIGEIFTEEYLRELVKTTPNLEIAKIHDCSPSVVRKYLKKYNIKCYNSRKGKVSPNRIQGDWFRHGHWWVYDEVRRKRVRRYIYNMEQFIGKEIDSKKYSVHHLNGDPTDDRIENLIILKKKEHDRLHLILRNKHIKLDNTWTASKVVELLITNPTDEMKRYAELTRMVRINRKKWI